MEFRRFLFRSADRLELSLDLIAAVYTDPSPDGWNGFGLAVQAYLRRAPFVIDAVVAMARKVGRPMPVRLVKGAYWAAEIKREIGRASCRERVGQDVLILVVAVA